MTPHDLMHCLQEDEGVPKVLALGQVGRADGLPRQAGRPHAARSGVIASFSFLGCVVPGLSHLVVSIFSVV